MRNSTYSVKQQNLYPTLRTMWASCLTNVEAMSAVRGIYTEDYINAVIADIATAEALPNEAARSAMYETRRVEMEALAVTCCARWRFLKMYIRNSFAEEVQEIAYTEAGWADYDGAAHQSWSAVTSIMQQGFAFISNNLAQLKDGGNNMPDAFSASFSAAQAAFDNAWAQYRELRQKSEELTAQKIDANNAIYKKTIEMGLDGQECFYNNEPLRKQFVFDTVASLVAPGGPSGVVIEVTDAETGKPLLAEVTDIITDRRVEANPEGRAEMSNLSAGDTTLLITCDGYTQQDLDCTLKTSTTSRFKIQMTPVVMQVTSTDAVVSGPQTSVSSPQSSVSSPQL